MSDKLWSACPAFFCLCPAYAPLHIVSISLSLFSSFALSVSGRPDKEENKEIFFCHTVALHLLSPVGIRYSLNSFSALLATLKSLTFDIPQQLCTAVFYPLTVKSAEVDLIHSSLSKNAWTKLYFTVHKRC